MKQSIDLYAGLPNRFPYLPRFEASEIKYQQRVQQSILINYYKQSIDHITSVLSFVEFEQQSPLTLAQDLGMGYNLFNFLTVADTIAQRDGGLYIDVGDPEKLTHVSLGMLSGKDGYNNAFGKRVSVNPADLIPYFYCFGLPEPGAFKFKPLHEDLLETNLAWFRLNSMYHAVLNYFSKPVIVRSRNQIVSSNKQEPVDFEAGNKLVEIASGEELFFLTLDTSNVEVQLTELIRLEDKMNEQLNRVLAVGVVEKTATEINYIRAEAMLTFSSLVKSKRGNVMRMFYEFYSRHYPQYTNAINLQVNNPYAQDLSNLKEIDIA
jgi:hypothetical protein